MTTHQTPMETSHSADCSDCSNNERRRFVCLLDLEPEARYLLEAMRLNNFENALNALELYLADVDLFDSSMTFTHASHTLSYAVAAFEKIDANKDRALSKEEINRYAGQVDQHIRSGLEWIVQNTDALSRAGLIKHRPDQLTRRDLESARDVFRGLSYIQRHFSSIAKDHGDGKPVLKESDILDFVFFHRSELSEHDLSALRQVIVYLRRLEGSRPEEEALNEEDLASLTPRSIWAGAAADAS